MFPGVSRALAGTPGSTVFSSEHHPDSHAVQGRSSHPSGAMPSWNATALLQPNRRANSVVDLRSSGSNQSLAGQYQASRERSNTAAPESMVFQFASANETSSSGPPSGASTPSNGDVPSANGVGTWIERMNNVQSRSSIPQAKRRKTEDGQDFAARTNNIPVRSSSGVLGQYVAERRKEANGQGLPQTLTVDLTDGKRRCRSH